jgi:hypothetical protein
MYVLARENNISKDFKKRISNFRYFFLPSWKKDYYEREIDMLERELIKKIEENRKKEHDKRVFEEMRAWERQRIGEEREQVRTNRPKVTAPSKHWGLPSVDSSFPDYNNDSFDKKANQMKDTLDKHSFDHIHPLKDDHHHHRDHHNDHKASWGHDAGWNHGDSHKSDSTHDTHDSHSHDSSSSCDSGGGDCGGDGGGD